MKNLVIFSIIFMSLLVVWGCGDTQEGGTSVTPAELTATESAFDGEVNYIWHNNVDFDWIVIDGTVKNNTNSIQDGIKMELTVRDGNKKLLGTDTAYLSSMKPGETAVFYGFITHTTCSTSALDLSWKFTKSYF